MITDTVSQKRDLLTQVSQVFLQKNIWHRSLIPARPSTVEWAVKEGFYAALGM